MKLKILRSLFALILLFAPQLFNAETKKDTLQFRTTEITVSSLRYPEKVLEVPLSVSLLGKENLFGIRGLSIEEPLSKVPGVLAQTRSGSSDIRISVRGFGSRGAGDRSNSGTVRGLRFLLDGIPQTEPDGRTSLDFFEPAFVETIEIIRSNSSALWGNSAGAVLDFRTTPEIFQNSAEYQITIGNWNLQKNIFKLQTTLGEKSGIYLNLSHNKFEGWRVNSNSERFLVNFGLLSNFSKKTIARINVNLTKNSFHIPGAITQVAYDSLPSSANPTYLKNKERRNNKLAQIGFSLIHNFDENNSLDFQGFLTSKYLQRSERGTFRDFTRYFLGSSATYRTQFHFSEIRNIFLIGYDQAYQDGAILFYKLDSLANRSNILQANKSEGASTFGFFAQNEIIYRELSILIGARYDNATYNAQDFMNFTFSDKKEFNRLTPKLGLSYQFIPNNLTIFANIGGGIEVPAGNETDPPPGQDTIYQLNPLLEPIRSTTYEIGIKSFWEISHSLRALEFDFSAFYIDTRNELIPYRDGRFYFSAGKTSRLGLETSFNLSLIWGINLSTALTFMSHRFIEYKIDSGYYNPEKKGIFADFKNNKLPGVPDYFYNLSLHIPFYIDFEISAQGVGQYFADDGNKFSIPPYTIFNTKIWVEQININNSLQLSLAFSVNNLLDRKYVGSAFLNPILEKGTNLPYFIESGLPRNFVFSLKIKAF
ncbi:MAG: TonB-dependent receptor family protein [Candidatus Kapaibacteriales bacterium]